MCGTVVGTLIGSDAASVTSKHKGTPLDITVGKLVFFLLVRRLGLG